MEFERWRRLDALLGRALGLEKNQRPGFLDSACSGDEDLRKKLDALLVAHEQAGNFIELPALAVAAEALAVQGGSMVGRQLAHYHVSALVAVGGMGTVWKARDINLNRDVAIKTLPEGFHDLSRLAKLEREAKLLASLNHPNVATIHGLDEVEGARFLVLEYVEGETLAEHLRRGAIPLQDSLRFAKQISEALAAAHDKGIIHRDLKPANIKITPDGTVKILDFGLAKALTGDAEPPAEATISERNVDVTQEGLVQGTAAYMSPEQARGMKADRRADIWAFGVVMYEMITGIRPFDGADSNETIKSVVTIEPDFGKVPRAVRRIVKKCLEKDPKNRLRDIGDVWELLEPSTTDKDLQRRALSKPEWIVASILGIVCLATLLWFRASPLLEVRRFEILAPPGHRLPPGTPAFSTDGDTLAFVVTGPDGVNRIHLRPLNRTETRVIAGTEGALHPFWSPGHNALAFAARTHLWRTDLTAGPTLDLGVMNAAWQGAWNQYGDILFRRDKSLHRVSSAGGTPAPVPDSTNAAFPAFLQDGKRFLVRVMGDGRDSIELRSLDSAERTLVVDNISSAPILAPTPGGRTYLLLLRGSGLWAYEFDQETGRILGSPELVMTGVTQLGNPPVLPAVGVSSTGLLAYQKGPAEVSLISLRLKIVNRSGEVIRELSEEMSVGLPRLSPDQRFVVGLRLTDGLDVWVTDLERGTTDRKTFDNAAERFVLWAKDSSSLVFLREGEGVFAIDAFKHSEAELLTSQPVIPTSMCRNYLLYTSPSAPNGKIYLLDLTRPGQPRQVGSPAGNSSGGEFSPDCEYIAFDSNRSGRHEVFIQPLVGGRELRVSEGGGKLPRWRGDGKEIFFISPDGNLMAAEIKTGDVLEARSPTRLFTFDRLTNKDPYHSRLGYDVFHDGKQFLVFAEPQQVDYPITMVDHWWVELEKERSGR